MDNKQKTAEDYKKFGDLCELSGKIVRISIDTPKLLDACDLIRKEIEEYSDQQMKELKKSRN